MRHSAQAMKISAWSPSRSCWVLVFILAAAAAVRLPAIGHDLPALYTHDEVSTVETALRFGGGSLEPYSFGHGPLMAYIIAALFGVYYLGLRLTGAVSQPEDLIVRYITDPTPFYLINRGVTIALAIGVVLMVFFLGKRLFHARVGLIAALLAAFVNLFVVLSLAGREDLLYLLLLLTGVYASVPLYERQPRGLSWFASGGLIGLATAAKYFAVVGLLFPVIAGVGRDQRVRRGLTLLAAGFLAGVLIGMPSVVMDFRQFAADVAKLATQTSGKAQSASLTAGLAYPTIHLANAIGIPLYAALLVSAAVLLLRERRLAVYLVGPSLLFLAALVSRRGNQGHYYVAFVVPFACLAVARVVDQTRGLLSAGWPRVVATGGLLAALVMPNVAADLRYLRYLAMPDTREAAKRWIEKHIPLGSLILIETGGTDFGIRRGPPLEATPATLTRELEQIRRAGGSGRMWELKLSHAVRDRVRPQYDLVKVHTVTGDHLELTAHEFVVLSHSAESTTETHLMVEKHYRRVAIFRSSANFRGDVLTSIDGVSTIPLTFDGPAGMKGPTLSIWERKPIATTSGNQSVALPRYRVRQQLGSLQLRPCGTG